MSRLSRRTLPDGSNVLVRPRYRATDYTAPPDKVAEIAALSGTGHYTASMRAPLASDYIQTEDTVVDGKRWVRYSHKGDEFGVEIEVTPDGKIGDVRGAPPEWAYEAASWRDADARERVVNEEDI